MNLVKMRSSKEGFIAEVNEDLYKDSVDTINNYKNEINHISDE